MKRQKKRSKDITTSSIIEKTYSYISIRRFEGDSLDLITKYANNWIGDLKTPINGKLMICDFLHILYPEYWELYQLYCQKRKRYNDPIGQVANESDSIESSADMDKLEVSNKRDASVEERSCSMSDHVPNQPNIPELNVSCSPNASLKRSRNDMNEPSSKQELSPEMEPSPSVDASVVIDSSKHKNCLSNDVPGIRLDSIHESAMNILRDHSQFLNGRSLLSDTSTYVAEREYLPSVMSLCKYWPQLQFLATDKDRKSYVPFVILIFFYMLCSIAKESVFRLSLCLEPLLKVLSAFPRFDSLHLKEVYRNEIQRALMLKFTLSSIITSLDRCLMNPTKKRRTSTSRDEDNELDNALADDWNQTPSE